MPGHTRLAIPLLFGLAVSAAAQQPSPTLPTSVVVTDGDTATAGVRVLVASCPPFTVHGPLGWRLDHDGPAEGDGRLVLPLDRRRHHVAWAVTPDRRRVSDLVPVTLGREVVLPLQRQDLERIDFEIDAGWFVGDDAPTQVFAFDMRMPGISFPIPLPASARSSIGLPPLPLATKLTKSGKKWTCDWVLPLADRNGQWCVAEIGFGLYVDEDRVARLRITAPEASSIRIVADVEGPYFEFRPATARFYKDHFMLGIQRVVAADGTGAYPLRAAKLKKGAAYCFQVRAPGHELLAGVMRATSGSGNLALARHANDLWRLCGAKAEEGVLLAHCAVGGSQVEPCVLPISGSRIVEVPTAAAGNHRYDLFWWRGNDCVPLVWNGAATGAEHTADLDQAHVVPLRCVSPTGSLPEDVLLAPEADFVRAVTDGHRGMLYLPVAADGIAVATLLPGSYAAVSGGATTRFRVGTEPPAAPIEVRHAALAEFTTVVKARVAGPDVAGGYGITIDVMPLGALTPEQQVEVQMARKYMHLERPGEFELVLPRSVAAWKVTAEGDVPRAKQPPVPHRATAELPTKAGAPLLLRLAPVAPAGRK